MNKDVKKYFSSVPMNRKEIIMKLHDLIVDLYPDAHVDMSYKMPTYKAQDGWVALANQKNYVSLHAVHTISQNLKQSTRQSKPAKAV